MNVCSSPVAEEVHGVPRDLSGLGVGDRGDIGGGVRDWEESYKGKL